MKALLFKKSQGIRITKEGEEVHKPVEEERGHSKRKKRQQETHK